jgi:phage tail-like protein
MQKESIMNASTTSNIALAGAFFTLESQGTLLASFSKVSGAEYKHKVVEYRYTKPDGKPEVAYQNAGYEVTDLICERGLLTEHSQEMFSWRDKVQQGLIGEMYKDCNLVARNPDGAAQLVFELYKCFPHSWGLSNFDAGNNQVVVEKMTFKVHYVVVKPA